MDGNLRSLFRQHLVPLGVDCQAVETAMTGGGVPDWNYCADGREGWVEHKKTNGWAVKIQPDQVGWILRRVRHGGRVLVAVRRALPAGPRRGPAVDELWLFHGLAIKQLKEGGLLSVDAGHRRGTWDGGPARWDWGAVLAVMKS